MLVKASTWLKLVVLGSGKQLLYHSVVRKNCSNSALTWNLPGATRGTIYQTFTYRYGCKESI